SYPAPLRRRAALRRIDELTPDPLVARRGEQADVHEQVHRGGAAQVQPAQRPSRPAHGQEVRFREVRQVVAMLQVELLVQEGAAHAAVPVQLRELVLAGAGVQIAQPGVVVFAEPTQRNAPRSEGWRRLQMDCPYLREPGTRVPADGVSRM